MFTDGFNETHVLDNFIIIYALLHSSRVGNRNSDNFLNIKKVCSAVPVIRQRWQKRKKKKSITKCLRQKHSAAVLPLAVMTYRLVAAHTPPPEPLFHRHSSASWWSHRGGIWPGWCHSLLWCSHPHPTDHFCKTKSRFSGALIPMGQSDHISHFAIMDKHASPEGRNSRVPAS